ncbi:hypothetical protein N0V88_001863 [Collariella sp. IMI 366227]|nr:hypothetical protein N0V88_001863 [Collariella sp. IMI 366227]
MRRRGLKDNIADELQQHNYANLGETSTVSPVQNPDEEPIRRFISLEQVRSQEQEFAREQKLQRRQSLAEGRPPEHEKPEEGKFEVSRFATQLYTISYLVLFSILGTLARLGLQALTTYPGTPVIFPSLWPNFAGSLIMGSSLKTACSSANTPLPTTAILLQR